MKKLLLTVDYTNGVGKNGKNEFWAESSIKNLSITQNEGEGIHDTIKRAVEDIDYAEMSYNGKPQSNIYVDTDDKNNPKLVGYVYRVKHNIEDRGSNFSGIAYFDAWVTIKEVIDIPLVSCE